MILYIFVVPLVTLKLAPVSQYIICCDIDATLSARDLRMLMCVCKRNKRCDDGNFILLIGHGRGWGKEGEGRFYIALQRPNIGAEIIGISDVV